MIDKERRKRLATFLREARESRGISQRKLAKMLDVTYQTISSYETARTSPTRTRLHQIIVALDADISELKLKDPELYEYIYYQIKKLRPEGEKSVELIGIDDNVVQETIDALDKPISEQYSQDSLNSSYHINKWIDIPVFNGIRQGSSMEGEQEIIGQTRIPPEWSYGGKTYFALSVNEDRNSPVIETGDIVIAEITDTNIDNESYVVYHLNGSDARIGRYYNTDGIINLDFDNNAYKPIEIGVFDKLKIIGVVKESRRRFK